MPSISALGMFLILHAFGVFIVVLMIAFGVVSITIIKEARGNGKYPKPGCKESHGKKK